MEFKERMQQIVKLAVSGLTAGFIACAPLVHAASASEDTPGQKGMKAAFQSIWPDGGPHYDQYIWLFCSPNDYYPFSTAFINSTDAENYGAPLKEGIEYLLARADIIPPLSPEEKSNMSICGGVLEIIGADSVSAYSQTLTFIQNKVNLPAVTVAEDGLENILLQAAPNPFMNCTEISFSSQTMSYYTIDIYDAAGRTVMNLFKGHLEKNSQLRILWKGTDREGKELAAGVYFCRVSSEVGSEQAIETKKILLLK
ncbi:MAG: T9SS type A sorting domain-containing protein [Nanoarchaeota archaeon]